MVKKRLDIALVERGFYSTRAKAQANIMAGKIIFNGKVETKAGRHIKEEDLIEIKQNICPYVSRGGLKLKAALDAFKISAKEKICVDIGTATGGFTDCLIKEGAAKVYSIDVGKGQIDANLLKNPKVIFIPETNARYLKPEIFLEKPKLAAIDVSFISLKLILAPLINCLYAPSDIIALIKPQFELMPKKVPKGVVKKEEYRQEVVEDLKNFISLQQLGQTSDIIASPIKGTKGNIEYLWHIKIS